MENSKTYKERIKRHTPKTNLKKTLPTAFLTGGALCALGELMAGAVRKMGVERSDAYLTVTVTVIFIASLLTALGIFDKLAKYAGAGLSVPVSGFANSVTSSALDTRREGLVLGLGAGVFTVAGPVILYAVLSGTLYGITYYILKMLGVA